jgi:hypothetical protein
MDVDPTERLWYICCLLNNFTIAKWISMDWQLFLKFYQINFCSYWASRIILYKKHVHLFNLAQQISSNIKNFQT